ncbi:HNH endonuclease [Pseudonocardia sp. TRM90224]|uniref:HNH endonuclease n=1 Tax=Pseudonocardia sp. TRM90224 TaxID=2812678 RepID=UPI001E297259|nr:HNH endonuclease [Pseudonocardia sp. TRM90224]
MIAEAAAIRAEVLTRPATLTAPDPDLDGASAHEGGLLERRHFARERDRKLRDLKIASVRNTGQPIRCEVCTFDFARTYGDRGRDYVECHHRLPLHASGPVTTKLADLALLCSNCHRMIHRRKPWLTIEQLTELVGRRDTTS